MLMLILLHVMEMNSFTNESWLELMLAILQPYRWMSSSLVGKKWIKQKLKFTQCSVLWAKSEHGVMVRWRRLNHLPYEALEWVGEAGYHWERTVWITNKLWKILKEMGIQTTLPASWKTCMWDKKQQLELDMEKQTKSKLGMGYIKVVYYHSD